MTGILVGYVGATYSTKPGTPTSVSASATAYNSASVSFTAPFNGGLPIDSYVATSCPGGITGSSASSPVSVSGLTGSTSYTFKVKAHNSLGYGCCSSSSGSITTPAPPVSATIMVVAGGGQGGFVSGGGAGGVVCGTYNLTRGISYTVTVGGGAPQPTYNCNFYAVYYACCSPPPPARNGNNSSFIGTGLNLTANGGGGGGLLNACTGASGGSGGGGAPNGGACGGGSGSQGGRGGGGYPPFPVLGGSGGGAGGNGYGYYNMCFVTCAVTYRVKIGIVGGIGKTFSLTGHQVAGGGSRGCYPTSQYYPYWNGSSLVRYCCIPSVIPGWYGGGGGGRYAGGGNGDGSSGAGNTGGGGGASSYAGRRAGTGGSGTVFLAAVDTPSCISGASYLGCYCGQKVYRFTGSGNVKY